MEGILPPPAEAETEEEMFTMPSLKVRTAASQAAYVEFKSRRGHLWVGRIVAIAADCKSADSGLRQFESGPAHLCLRVRVKLKV